MISTSYHVTGMTCEHCTRAVSAELRALDGVAATVNLATETAKVDFPSAITVKDLITVIQQAGYTAAIPAPRPEAEPAAAGLADAGPRRRLLVTLALAIPVIVVSMLPPLR